MAGGVALNCVANGKLIKENIFKNIWIQPASGDAGNALGAALIAYYQFFKKERIIHKNDSMKGTYLGPYFSNQFVRDYLDSVKAKYEYIDDENLFQKLAYLLNEGKVIGWFNGPMEFGPRALGGRSIIGDPRNKKMQSVMNLKLNIEKVLDLLHHQSLKKKLEIILIFLVLLLICCLSQKLRNNL